MKSIGIDIIEIERFSPVDNSNEFLEQIFCASEMQHAPTGKERRAYFALLFGIKEAILKALGCGLHQGSFWNNIEVTKEFAIHLSGVLQDMATSASISNIHLSFARSRKYIVALVVFE